jgi:hypothetical protein
MPSNGESSIQISVILFHRGQRVTEIQQAYFVQQAITIYILNVFQFLVLLDNEQG